MQKKQRYFSLLLFLAFLLYACLGCGATAHQQTESSASPIVTPTETVVPVQTEAPTPEETVPQPIETVFSVTEAPPIEAEASRAPQTEPPAVHYTVLEPQADGIAEKRASKAVIDYSHVDDGYVMVQKLKESSKRFKVQIKKGGETYTYNLPETDWAVLPLSLGDGKYNVGVYENVSGTKYASVVSVSFDAVLSDPFAPFLRPNLYVNYQDAPATVEKGGELTAGLSGPLQKVDAVYAFVVGTLNYDYVQAATVESGYIPKLDRVLKVKRGICYDYAALMTAMLRSQNVPCKLIFGYVGKAYHAWISVWVDEEGWVNAIYFDGVSWQRMDPTFASSGGDDETIKALIGDGKNYAEKYSY